SFDRSLPKRGNTCDPHHHISNSARKLSNLKLAQLGRCPGHLLDLQGLYIHAVDYVWKQRCHIIVAHSHIGHNFLKRYLFFGKILVLLITVEFSAELGDFALRSSMLEGTLQSILTERSVPAQK